MKEEQSLMGKYLDSVIRTSTLIFTIWLLGLNVGLRFGAYWGSAVFVGLFLIAVFIDFSLPRT